ncbi:AraC family transcriptional regulator [Enterococcus ureasiticus]|uniref:AraC effector-binding domain-containing protein n=1 Tax=Enterococcus ureasiticus TaxID=903984 RepID=A0A1E5GMU2_9ENTE|nr:GyrI-like domain-containing protein [Enterococcus ureasiticus]OEG14023.1 hypothetical protein BCR21_03255 [Enterococcus ureasiticus]
MNIKQIPETKIIYMRRTGVYGIENKNLMENFKKWLKDNNLFNSDSVILAIPRDNPQTTDPKNCRYDVALVVNSFNDIEQLDINNDVLESGKYAIFTVEHTEEAIIKAMGNMFSEIDSEGHSLNARQPIIERYAVKMVENNKCEICVPLS